MTYSHPLTDEDKAKVDKLVESIKSKKGNRMSKQEALAWQAGQLELVNQLIELLPTHNIEGLLKDWKKTLVNREPV